MGRFIGGFADLTGYRLGEFEIEVLAGRDGEGYPKWKVVCGKCGDVQIISHKKLKPLLESKAVDSFQCTNGACPLSRSHRTPVSLSDFRRQERAEAEQAAQLKQGEQSRANADAAKQAKLAAIKTEYREYYVHQLNTKAQDSQIVSFDRWCQLTPETRKQVLTTLRNDPGAYYTKL